MLFSTKQNESTTNTTPSKHLNKYNRNIVETDKSFNTNTKTKQQQKKKSKKRSPDSNLQTIILTRDYYKRRYILSNMVSIISQSGVILFLDLCATQ